MPNTILPGYVAVVGDKYALRFDHSGPVSYTRISGVAAPFTGGDLVNASDLGVGGFDIFDVPMLDNTAQWYGLGIPVGGGGGNAVKQVVIVWFSRVTATVGGQAQTAFTEAVAGTNLSAFKLRCDCWAV